MLSHTHTTARLRTGPSRAIAPLTPQADQAPGEAGLGMPSQPGTRPAGASSNTLSHSPAASNEGPFPFWVYWGLIILTTQFTGPLIASKPAWYQQPGGSIVSWACPKGASRPTVLG